jgi:hypothetical protein
MLTAGSEDEGVAFTIDWAIRERRRNRASAIRVMHRKIVELTNPTAAMATNSSKKK